jgi:hypothetical protein
VTAAAEGAVAATSIPGRRRLPSAGFVSLCGTYLAVGAFLSWGLSTPPLDRVWVMHHELKVGRRGAPKAADLRQLRDALERYPGLTTALLPEGEIGLISAHREGWVETPEATILRTDKATERVLRIEVGTPLDLLPFAIDVEGDTFEREVKAKDHGVLEVPLPPVEGHGEAIVVRLRGKKLRADPSVLNVRLTFADAADASSGASGGGAP